MAVDRADHLIRKSLFLHQKIQVLIGIASCCVIPVCIWFSWFISLSGHSDAHKKFLLPFLTSTLQPLYNTVHYYMVLDITFKNGSQKYIDYMEK